MSKAVLDIYSRATGYVEEFLKCKNSFEYFCENYIYIESPGGDKKLTPYEPQKKLVTTIDKYHYVIVLKSRQIGISTIIQSYIVWLCCFYTNAVIGIISKDGKEATDFARHIMSMLDKLPKWLAPKFSKRTEQTFILDNGCKCYATPVNPNAPEKTLRGKAITLLVIDEAAFIKFMDIAWTGMVPALATNQMQARKAKIPFGTILLSTPNKTQGVGKWFYEKYTKSVSGEDIFVPVKIHYKQVKELFGDANWYKTQCAMFGNDTRSIQQELELKFLTTTGSFFPEEISQQLQDLNQNPIEVRRIFNGDFWRFSRPKMGRYYIIGVDTAPEHGQDKSALTVWDYESLEQVADYQGKLPVQDFVKIIKVVCAQYPGTIVIESNSYGNQVLEELRNSEYYTMVYKEKRQNLFYPGLSNNTKTRPLMIDALYSYISEYPEIVKSTRLALELIGLISKPSGKVEADTGCNDDLALSAALAFYVRKYDPPVLIGTSKIHQEDFMDIVGFNEDIFAPTNVTNKSIFDRVKKQLPDGSGYVDVFDFYRE